MKFRSACLVHLTAQLEKQLNMLRMSKKSKTEASSDICSLKKPIFYFVNLGEVAYEIGLR